MIPRQCTRVIQDLEDEFTGISKEIALYLLNIAAVLVGVLFSFQYNWPDYVHTDYGFPLAWATHTTTTIVGPVDKWNVNLANLVLNIVFWLSISFLAYLSCLWMRTRHTKKKDRSKD